MNPVKDHLIRHWYQYTLALILLTPALLLPQLISFSTVRHWEDQLYQELLTFQTPDSTKASNVVIIDVDEDSINELGWPIDRDHYRDLLKKLSAAGQPWLVSLLQFQPLAKGVTDPPIRAQLDRKDKAFAKEVAKYGKVIGSALEANFDEEISIWAEENLMPRIVFNAGTEAPYIPTKGLTLLEADSLVDVQRAFGMPTRLSASDQVFCNQMYITDASYQEIFVVPSSLVLGAAFFRNGQIRTASGAQWPRAQQLTTGGRDVIPLGYEHCVSSPAVDTQSFFATRQIPRYSFVDFIRQSPPALKDKIVVLTSSESRSFIGPGAVPKYALTTEHNLAVRFLDDLLTGSALRRDHSYNRQTYPWLSLSLSLLLVACALFFSLNTIIGFGIGLTATQVAISAWHLVGQQTYLIYLVPLLCCLLTTCLLVSLKLFLVYYGSRRQLAFGALLREQFSRCNSLRDLEKAVQRCTQFEFAKSKTRFIGYDKDYYAVLEQDADIIHLVESKAGDQWERPPDFHESVQTSVGRRPATQRGAFSGKQLELKLIIDDGDKRLGRLQIHLTYLPHEIEFVGLLVDTLRLELSQHWSRIDLLAKQKFKDFEMVLEKTRTQIMSRFLADSVVDRFEDHRSMEENFKRVLSPRTVNAAIIQADIRGYSSISAALEPMQMIRILKMYFSEIVDTAQKLAQIKLIGDCIFMFIEEGNPNGPTSASDQALFLVSYLVKVTETQNRELEQAGFPLLNFGIAINYGQVVMGNLSSDNCIDYTVIGDNVNKVDRLEELTKHEAIQNTIGRNGTIISKAAAENMRQFAGSSFASVTLSEIGAKVRSFEDIETVHYASAADILAAVENNSMSRDQEAG